MTDTWMTESRSVDPLAVAIEYGKISTDYDRLCQDLNDLVELKEKQGDAVDLLDALKQVLENNGVREENDGDKGDVE